MLVVVPIFSDYKNPNKIKKQYTKKKWSIEFVCQ